MIFITYIFLKTLSRKGNGAGAGDEMALQEIARRLEREQQREDAVQALRQELADKAFEKDQENVAKKNEEEIAQFWEQETKKQEILKEVRDLVRSEEDQVEFMHCDFRKIFKRISFGKNDKSKAFVYCDPPYLGTADNYEAGFTPLDSSDLFDTLEASGLRWAMSEFDHPFILEQARERGLEVVEIGERQNLKNRRVEVLVVNYEVGRELRLF